MTRVLVVDDDADLGALVATTLTAAGYDPSVVTNGGAALARVRARPPDLILSDLAMPALDGLSLRAELGREGYGDIPVLLMSAHQRPATVPAEAFLAKPFDLATLLLVVQQMLRLSARRGGLGDHARAHPPRRRTA